jgi:hypothetical protein
MKLIRLMFIVFAIGFANGGRADENTAMGFRGCGTWIKDRAEKSWAATVEEGWLTGYLSGIAISSDVDFLKGADGNSFMFWMDNYCRDNPLSNLAVGGFQLASELKKRMHK